jgi:hypothetical protein
VRVFAHRIALCALLGLFACTRPDGGAVRALPPSTAIQQRLTTQLTTRARELEGRDDAIVRVEHAASDHSPTCALMLYSEIHAHTVELLELDAQPGNAILRRTRVEIPLEPSLSDDPPALEQSEIALRADAAHDHLAALWSLASVNLEISLPEPEPGQIALRALRTTSLQHSYVLRVQSDGPALRERRYAGSTSNLAAPELVPLELAWQILSEPAPTWQRTSTTETASRALTDIWPTTPSEPWELSRFLSLAYALPSPQLTAQLLNALDSPDPSVTTLAVNALAAATGQDLRRNPDGTIRSLSEIVTAYRHLP